MKVGRRADGESEKGRGGMRRTYYAYCPVCQEKVSASKHPKARFTMEFVCECGCHFRTRIEDLERMSENA